VLKIAYQVGVDMALKEAGLSRDEFEKLAKFLWYRDVAEALPTFRRLLGLNPEMAHRVAQTAGKAGTKAVKKAPARQLVSRAADPRMATFSPGAFKR
jgi:hypothetical protein